MSPYASYLLMDQVLPRLVSAIPNAVSFIAPENAEDLVQDGVAIAAKMMDNAEKDGKSVVKSPSKPKGKYRKQTKEVTAGNIAYYTIQKLRSGRRSTGASCSDAHGSATQLCGRSRLSSLDGETGSVDDFGEPLLLHDVLASQQECPATRAARVVDWSEFMARCSKRDLAIIHCIVEGKPLASLARRRHLNTSTILYHKRRLADALASYMGPDIIIEIQRRPGWQDSIDATRMKMACRDERRHL